MNESYLRWLKKKIGPIKKLFSTKNYIFFFSIRESKWKYVNKKIPDIYI